MGKNVLRHLGAAVPGAAPTSPSSASPAHATLLLILLVVVAFFVGTVKTDDLLRMRLLRGLAMAGTRYLPQSNISQTEFETKHREYFDLVEQNQRRRLISTFNYDEENIVRKKLFRFTHSGLEISRCPSGSLYDLTYDVHIPAAEGNALVDIDDTSIRLLIVPTICDQPRSFTLRAVRPDAGLRPVSEATTFFTDPACRPRWVALDLAPFAVTHRDRSLTLRIEVEGTGVRLAEPYLNVIASVRTRQRRRRRSGSAPVSRRSRRSCDRAPLEVNFAALPGYQYIVQPKTINVGLCSGRCPVRWRMTQHAILQHLVSKNDATVPKPCCSPSKMEGLEYLYLSEDDSSKLNVGFWNDTIVVECRCS